MENSVTEDKYWMRQALKLARKGWGKTTPNPMVGAVVVRNNQLLGQGYHQRAGRNHAEVEALQAAGGAAAGADLYVNLEPCSTSGRTPPCVDAILQAGIRRVVVGCTDANPCHAGRGLDILRLAGLQVQSGVLAEPCRQLNEAFFCWVRRRQPFVILKMAMTLDGKIATASGQSQWITGPAARRHVQQLRQLADAIMVGGETVRHDNPSLTVRTPQHWWRQPRKFIWSGRTDFSADLAVFQGAAPTIVQPMETAQWRQFLQKAGESEIVCLLLEGGGELAGRALQAGIVDKVVFFVAPKILGGRASRPVVGGENPTGLAEALGVQQMKFRRIGADFLITGYLHQCSQD